MIQSEIIKSILGQGGALVLACVVLYNVMGSYEKLIDTMVQESKEDRAMYMQNMRDLSTHMDKVNETLSKIQMDIEEIKNK
tara:strand:+ start:188 stop:430 length:243 start_codon:yes stop_codon:yes gene_type:complete